MGSRIQLQQRNCSRFTRDFSRRSTDQPRNLSGPNSQRTERQVAACASALKIYLSASPDFHALNSKNLNFLVTGNQIGLYSEPQVVADIRGEGLWSLDDL